MPKGTKPNQNQSKSQISRGLIFFLILFVVGILLYVVIIALRAQSISSIAEPLTPHMTYRVVNVFPHDPNAFTQGLIYLDGYLYESTGLYGESSLRKTDLETGRVLQQADLSQEYFAEGLTAWEDSLVQLTWREGTGFVYSQQDFILLEKFSYTTEGWGLTHDGEHLIMSDGTDMLYFLDPVTYLVIDSVNVTYQNEGVRYLNELEFINGEIFANVFLTDEIVRINPDTGEVTGWIYLDGILPPESSAEETDVLNGIAYDAENDRLFITGKFWPNLFEIQLVPVTNGEQSQD
jgi:glutamine cyclotransferase